MCGIKIPQQDFALKMQGGVAYAREGAYLRDTKISVTRPLPGAWLVHVASACSLGTRLALQLTSIHA